MKTMNVWIGAALLAVASMAGVAGAEASMSPDFSGNGLVDWDDFFVFADGYGTAPGDARFNPALDLNNNGRIDSPDFFLFAQNFGRTASEVDLTLPTSPGPNAGARLVASLDRTCVTAGEKVTLTLSVTGASGLTGYVAEALYDSVAVKGPIGFWDIEDKLPDAIHLWQISEPVTGMAGFNRRTEVPGAHLPYNPFTGNTDLVAFKFTTKAGFTTTPIGVPRLILVAGAKIDTIVPSPSPLVLQIVVDTTPPSITLKVSPTALWPPDHKMVLVAKGISATDACDLSPALNVAVTSNEPVNGLGDGDTAPDWEVKKNADGTFDVWVRAERSGKGSGRVYTITATATDYSGNSASQIATVTVGHDQGKKAAKVALSGEAEIVPEAFEVDQNHPNPFNPATTIRYALPEGVDVQLIVYNILGQRVKALVDGAQGPGYYTAVWDGKDERGRQVASGVYIYRLQAGSFVQVRKMVLAK